MRTGFLLWCCALLALGCESTNPDALTTLPGCEARCEPGARRCEADGRLAICADDADSGCGQWESPEACAEGLICTDGICAAQCDDTCAEGEQACTTDGRRDCVVDADGCRRLGPPTACAEGERCDDGACVPADRPCSDSCGPADVRACNADGYRSCGNFDADACLEWSITSACGLGDSCAEGECVAQCAEECVAGALRCVDGGVARCGQFDADACLELSAPSPCPDGERCDEGRCAPIGACEDACAEAGTSVCDQGGPRRCGQYDEDPCLDLSEVAPCGATSRCESGACQVVCEDECTLGAGLCVEGALARCGQNDADPCLEWGDPAPCGADERCDDGVCAPDSPCEDSCMRDITRCGDGGVSTCGQHDADRCVEWGPEVPCLDGEACTDGACTPVCESLCRFTATRCVGAALAECGDANGDGCTEWLAPVACRPGQSCSSGRCSVECTDDCPALGVQACAEGGVRQCGQFDADPCLDWSSPSPCGAESACVDGDCRPVCQSECDAGERRCLGDTFEICGNFDDDPCLEFGGGVRCEAGCVAGGCAEACVDECAEFDAVCTPLGRAGCGNFDDDPCLELAIDPCHEAERCMGGQCVPIAQELVINEVFYDGVRGDAPQIFVELHGEPGQRLDTLQLIGINGTNGRHFVEIDLEGVIPDSGFFVLAHTQANRELAALANQLHPGADMQNGPDTVQLVRGGTVLDAVGYGDFDDAVFAGEGQPVRAVEPGRSISRDEFGTDTDDNRADFSSSRPSPGR